MKKVIYLLFFVAMLTALAACNNSGNGEPTAAESAALAYAEAVLQNDDTYLNENTCDNVPTGSTSLDMYAMFTIGMAVRESLTHSIEDLEIDLQASTESQTLDEARIRIHGSVTFPQSLSASELAPLPVDLTTNLDEVWRMEQVGGEWKWCGGTENES